MNKLIIFLVIGIVFAQGMTTQENQIVKGRQLFSRLNKASDLGHQIFQTIELQLSQSDESDLDKVIRMLYEVRESVLEMANKLSSEKEERLGACLEQTQSIKDSISDLQQRIAQSKSFLPQRQTEHQNVVSQIETKKEEMEFYESELSILSQQNEQKIANFETKKGEHRKLIAALEEARRLIKQLQDQPNFLQTNHIFAELKQHHESQKCYLGQIQSQKMFSVLISLAKSVANQDDVNSVIEIIDQLIAAQEQIKYAEENSENARLQKFEADKLRFQQNIQQANADILEEQADLTTAKTRLRELERSIEDNQTTLSQKRSQLVDQEDFCENQVREIKNRGDSYARILEILDQVIYLLENSSIQTAREMIQMN